MWVVCKLLEGFEASQPDLLQPIPLLLTVPAAT